MNYVVESFIVYLLLCLITSILYTRYYYRFKLKEAFENASNKQKRNATLLTLVTSFILAPLVFVDYMLGNYKEETK